MADSGTQSARGSHHASPTPSAAAHHNNSIDNKHLTSHPHAKAPTATAAAPAVAATSKATIPNMPSMSNIFILPSNVPVINDPYFGRPSPATLNNTPTSTATPPAPVATSTDDATASPQIEERSIAGPLAGALLGSAGLVAVIIGVLIYIKRRKRRQYDNMSFNHCNGDGSSRAAALLCQQQQQQQRNHYHFKREESTRSDNTQATLQPPPAYTPHSQKRLTAETLVDQRASMSTMNSNYSSRSHQYAPQLAYKQQQEGTGCGHVDWDQMSPSNTLIDAAAVTMATTHADDEKAESRRQRVPSYQPQVVVMTEPADHATTGLNLNNNETTSYYDYLYQHTNNYHHNNKKEEH
ncbi:hypothetical protein BDB00DRAFT_783904 [Zychaea mexicana]|uniref:uncharacterized protein n=1 Tax=Zychaea mexicana TaxID=64656 RepID=UPI0022FE7306|nr:uncharacterized protein BDB00DRAFT_783904 [Zychaea mexicana]KAI9498812.1 hypothetical protein BDB00DRAFT_783904 [Zychaea mexicana]